MIGLWWALACAGATDSAETADPCADAPAVSWASVGEPILVEHCNTCHAATASDRFGAPPNVTFDSYDEVVTWRAAMLAAVESDPPAMPPVLPMSADEIELFASWLRCDVGAD